MPMEYLFLIILLVFMIGMMFFQTRKAKQQQRNARISGAIWRRAPKS